jgi:phosphatidylglycerol---prolipoprotein diacylglyceryl transferase
MAGFPYIHIPTLHLGPAEIQPFGILVASGVMLGSWMARKYAERNDLDEEGHRYLGIRLLIWGFLACHVLNTIFYEWERFQKDPWLMLKVWDGISSWGGVIGGGLALIIYTGIKKMDRLRWADWAAYGASGGWLLGRLACTVAHDHLGHPTDFALGVDFPGDDPSTTVADGRYPFDKAAQGIIRAHDLGLYEFLFLIPIFLAMVILERWKGRKPGFLMGFLAVTYSIPRFVLEFLRREETDPRFMGLTFAQYACILALIGGWLLLKRKVGPTLPSAVAEPEPAAPRREAGVAKKKPKKKR